ncbi:MAG: alpha/beta hydrolase [Pseudomonadota bacterium]|nr:alpha/beta hydrolase [Pseudomonadota bacterium]
MTSTSEPFLQTLSINGIRMRIAEQGEGPLVVLCHGFPEGWNSWRVQLAALSAAGYRTVAPDMRGYGGTDAPEDPSRYTMLHHVGDLVALVAALKAEHAVIVGHDWGAPVAWSAASLRPDLFRAVVGMSVPYSPPGPVDLLGALESRGVRDFYMQYFQTPGIAEAELEADVAASLRRITFSLSGDGRGGVAGRLGDGHGFLHNTDDPAQLPAWMNRKDLDDSVAEFTRTGFRGGLNWYRALRLNSELMAPWRGVAIRQPSLFIGGTRDDVLAWPASRASLEGFGRTLPGLRGCHLLEGAGHWVQRERAARVNELLLEFLASL